jgi:ribosomal protein L6P/L9E
MEDKIALDLGYSNLIVYRPCSSVKIRNLKNKIVLFGINKEHLNNIANSLKNYSKPDVYKGKGI